VEFRIFQAPSSRQESLSQFPAKAPGTHIDFAPRQTGPSRTVRFRASNATLFQYRCWTTAHTFPLGRCGLPNRPCVESRRREPTDKGVRIFRRCHCPTIIRRTIFRRRAGSGWLGRAVPLGLFRAARPSPMTADHREKALPSFPRIVFACGLPHGIESRD
jgi:hypothetical protein